MENLNVIILQDGTQAVEWTRKEKPCVNHWYRCKDSDTDFWKITKDFHSPETHETYYKIVEYYNGDILYCGHTLADIREILRANTYRMVI